VETDVHDELPAQHPQTDASLEGQKNHKGGLVVGAAIWIRKVSSPVAQNWHRRNGSWTSSYERVLQSLQFQYHDFPLFRLDRSSSPQNFARIAKLLYRPWDPVVFEEFWECCGLFVEPAFQRRGLGTMLCQWAVGQAEAEGVPIVLQSTIAGFRTYEKVGFKVFDELNWDDQPGVPKGFRAWGMVWEPRSREGEWLKRAKISAEEWTGKNQPKADTTSEALPIWATGSLQAAAGFTK
jgi:GNAT superfamily N-acetyltransferase